MNNKILGFLTLSVLFGGINIASAAGEAQCLSAKDRAAGVKTRVFNSYAALDVAGGTAKGLSNTFCTFTSRDHFGMIDLQTLTSKKPSIAATYLLKGVDVAALGKLIPEHFEGNPGTVYCEGLAGSSISRYTSGGFTSPGGQDEVCVFGDGSKISIWVLIYVSDDPSYLSMRKAVKSQPLNLALPYIKP